MNWDIVLGIIALVGFVGSICLWIWKLSKILTVLETTVGTLSAAIKEFKSDSRDVHKEMNDRLDDHERRIYTLEIKGNSPKN